MASCTAQSDKQLANALRKCEVLRFKEGVGPAELSESRVSGGGDPDSKQVGLTKRSQPSFQVPT